MACPFLKGQNMLTGDAKKYGLHSRDRKEKMNADQLGRLLKDLGIPFNPNASKKTLLDLLTNATPEHYLVETADPLQE